MKKNKEIFLIPYSHLDTQWRWEYTTTINKYIKNTLDESIAMFKKYPGHRFNFTGAIRYGMMKEYFPHEFEEVKGLIHEERWHLAGTCLDETDALIPSSESLVRNILYGDQWQKREFGRSSRDYMIPDCFGFPGNMPTVLAHCGIHGFSSQKLTWGSAVGIPFEIGIWRGPDGSEIVSALNPSRYDAHLELPVFLNPDRLARLKRLGKKNGIWKSFQYYGVGDVGGAPKEGSIRRALASIRHYKKRAGDLVVRQGSADQFFREVTEDEISRMDRYEGDFLLTNHSAGTITSAAIMKRWNRMNEQLAFAAEEAAVTAMLYSGASYPCEKIESAWKLMVGNQMHDILPGTSTPTAYEYSHNDEVIALKTWTNILEDAAETIAPHVRGEGEILLYNPLAQSRNEIVEVLLPPHRDMEEGTVVLENSAGETLPGTVVKEENGMGRLTFIPELPPASWTRFSLRSREPGEDTTVGDPVSLEILEGQYILNNGQCRVTVSAEGAVSSIICKETGYEILSKPLAYELQKERPMKFPAWNMDWRDRKRAPFERIEGGEEVSILENSSTRVKLQVKVVYGSSVLIKEISLCAGSAIVNFTERINWRETGCSLKLAIDASLEESRFTTNWETSRMARDVNHKKIFEVPSRMWADLSGKGKGLTVIEDSKYGWDRPRDNTIRMTLLYTPYVRCYNCCKDQNSHDWGEHTIRYGIQGHRGDWSHADHAARAFNQPVRSFLLKGKTTAAETNLSSLVSLSSDQIGLMAVKKKEDDDSVILRVYERQGKPAEATLHFALPIESVVQVNGLEEALDSVAHKGNSFKVDLEANGMKAFALKTARKNSEVKVAHKVLPLEYNSRLMGRNGEESKARIPSEIVPEKIDAGSISFSLFPTNELNAMRCEGQKIALKDGFNRISLLGSASEACESIFKWLGTDGEELSGESVEISSISEFAGQWDKRIWKRKPKHFLKNKNDYVWLNKCMGVDPGYINRNRLEWFSTHSHENGKDMAYQYSYLYNISLDIPEGAEMLLLPDDKRIVIAAATLSSRNITAESIQSLNDKFDF